MEEREYQNTVSCDHVYEKKCHTTFVTKFQPQQLEKCDEDYKKDCQIEFNTVTENKTQTVCHDSLYAENCEETGKDEEFSECQTEFETECITEEDQVQVYLSKHTGQWSQLFILNQITDDVVECHERKEEVCEEEPSGYTTARTCYVLPRQECEVTPVTRVKSQPSERCTRVPREFCFPRGSDCKVGRGERQCEDRVRLQVVEIPSEKCSVKPVSRLVQFQFYSENKVNSTCVFRCWTETVIVPSLEPLEECFDVPREVCSQKRGEARSVLKPLVKKDCIDAPVLLSVLP